MPVTKGNSNRGPAVADDNRRAVLGAARRLFSARGYRVPLNAIAREAGVGQAVLYRHFPTRLDLAFAVFEEHFVELEALASEPGPQAFGRVWSRLLELTIEEAAFVEMVVDARRNLPDYGGAERLLSLLTGPLDRARAAGLVDAGVTPQDVLLAQRMAYGIVVTALSPTDVPETVNRSLSLFGRLGADVPRPTTSGISSTPPELVPGH